MISLQALLVQMDSCKELSVQCVDGDVLTLVLRHLALPALGTVAIANVGCRRRSGELPSAMFPRLESIFRDPRLLHLTHLTLSHFQLDPEHMESLLGYMPALTSLVARYMFRCAEVVGGFGRDKCRQTSSHTCGSNNKPKASIEVLPPTGFRDIVGMRCGGLQN